MNRLQTGLLLACVVLAGCTGGVGNSSPTVTPDASTPENAGFVDVRAVASVPEGATVISVNNSSLEEIEPVQRAIEGAASDGGVTVPLRGARFNEVAEAMPDADRYDGDRFGWYVSYAGEVFWVRVIQYPE